MAAKIVSLFLLAVVATCFAHHRLEAKVKFTSGFRGIKGDIEFKELDDGWTEVKGKVSGLKPGVHGLHIHENGNLSDDCANVGGHFDPHHEPHGVHVGDVGNIIANRNGEAMFKLIKRNLELAGPHSIIGRSVGIDDEEDRFGDEDHLTIACGIIRLKDNEHRKHKH